MLETSFFCDAYKLKTKWAVKLGEYFNQYKYEFDSNSFMIAQQRYDLSWLLCVAISTSLFRIKVLGGLEIFAWSHAQSGIQAFNIEGKNNYFHNLIVEMDHTFFFTTPYHVHVHNLFCKKNYLSILFTNVTDPVIVICS